MKRASSKRGSERGSNIAKSKRNRPVGKEVESCCHCSKELKNSTHVLFVEEDVGRIFCSENCISRFFASEIRKLEKEYLRHVTPSDFSEEERRTLSDLRWVTLQNPREIWREETRDGDQRYTLISEFEIERKPLWCICICLFLRGEPSFLFLAVPTRNPALADFYRRGTRVQTEAGSTAVGSPPFQLAADQPSDQGGAPGQVDGLASAWTEDETLRAQLTQERRSDDIPTEEFGLYQEYAEETLEGPDEVWSLRLKGKSSLRLYHFLRYYPDNQKSGIWYIIVARETEDHDQIEILDAFPTRDGSLAERYRRGKQEVGGVNEVSPTRMVH